MTEIYGKSFSTEEAPKRYLDMGFPDEYKVEIYHIPGYGLSSDMEGYYLALSKWTPVYKGWKGAKYSHHKWSLVKKKWLSISRHWSAEDADQVAKSWLVEIEREKRLMDGTEE
jgi:hypothetical protein